MNRYATLPPLWNIPYPRNPFFTGREDVLKRLHGALQAENMIGLDPFLGGLDKINVV